MPTTEATLYDIRNGAAWITLNRPENRNALSSILVSELYEHLLAANEDPNVRSIVITGTGPAFCAGADLKSPPGQTIEGRRSVPYPNVLTQIMESDKPVIAAVNGAAFAGGLGLVGAADIVITVDEVQFSFSEVRIGVIPAVISVVLDRSMGELHRRESLFDDFELHIVSSVCRLLPSFLIPLRLQLLQEAGLELPDHIKNNFQVMEPGFVPPGGFVAEDQP